MGCAWTAPRCSTVNFTEPSHLKRFHNALFSGQLSFCVEKCDTRNLSDGLFHSFLASTVVTGKRSQHGPLSSQCLFAQQPSTQWIQIASLSYEELYSSVLTPKKSFAARCVYTRSCLQHHGLFLQESSRIEKVF